MKSAMIVSVVAVAAADVCSLYEVADGSCGQSDLDCAYTKYAKAAEAGLQDGTCADQGYTVQTGTQTRSYPIIGDITVTTYDKPALRSMDMDWAQYKQQFGKTYNGESEDAEREAVFNQNKQMWGQHESGAILGATVFSDLTAEEFASMPIRGFASGEASGLPKVGVHEFQGEELAAAVDWSTRGAVTPVKNQGQCGSCWAFSSTGGLEGSYQISSGKLVSLSEQQFVDCSKQNSGCNGGLMDYAFAFAEGTAVATESSYPYTARDGTCKTSFTTGIPRGGVTGYKDVSRSTSALQSALNVMPVSVAIQADQSVFQQYTGGVITSGCGTSLDHGVLAVGYDGTTIKVKNSWGTSWGVNGYVSIDASQCGITSSASYPTTSAAVEV
jgi:cathepsin L